MAAVEPGMRDKSYLFDRVRKFMVEIEGSGPGSPGRVGPPLAEKKESRVPSRQSSGGGIRDGRAKRAASTADALIAKVKENLKDAPNDPARFDSTRFRSGVPPPEQRKGAYTCVLNNDGWHPWC